MRHQHLTPMPLLGPPELCWDSLLRENQVAPLHKRDQARGKAALPSVPQYPRILAVTPAVRPEGGSWIPTHQAGLQGVCRARSLQATLWPLGLLRASLWQDPPSDSCLIWHERPSAPAALPALRPLAGLPAPTGMGTRPDARQSLGFLPAGDLRLSWTLGCSFLFFLFFVNPHQRRFRY